MQLEQIKTFQEKVWQFYKNNKRDFVWRSHVAPYYVFVSEIMLQQTQTTRVVPKFQQWIQRFPDFVSLAQASRQEVLHAWVGLGYNRRGIALHENAKRIVQEFNGQVPQDTKVLQTFSSIGSNTAASICAFAFNQPVIFIETNIRTVFLHEFFAGLSEVSDKQLMPFIQAAVDLKNPREWYWALMDYGVYLKKDLKANNKKSKHYTRQSRFEGSRRQMRGAIIRILTQTKKISIQQLHDLLLVQIPDNTHNSYDVIQQLVNQGLIQQDQDVLFL